MDPLEHPHKTRTEITIGILAVVVCILVVAIVNLKYFSGVPSVAPEEQSGEVTREAMPQEQAKTLVVPGVGASDVATGVAVPKLVTSARPNSTAQLRVFDVTANAGAFTPATIIVHQGDTVVLNITAQDKKYDFTQPDFGFTAFPLPKGKTTKVTFDATASGNFLFFCSASCNSTQKAQGHIIIVP